MGLLSAIGGLVQKTSSSLGNFLNKGGGTFKDPFLSIKGQEERLGNVAKTLTSAFTFGGVQTNRNIVKNKTVAKVLETAGSHPLISAGVVTGGVYGAKAAIKYIGGAKTVIGSGGAAAAVIPKASGILTQNKTPQALRDQETKVQTAQSQSIEQAALQAVVAKTYNQTQANVFASASNLLTGTHKTSRSRKSSRRKSTRRRSKKHKKVTHHRKLKFGSKAFRKKYLGHHKRKKHSKAKHHRKSKLKFGSPAYRRKYLGHK
jgi:hypothetical protein